MDELWVDLKGLEVQEVPLKPLTWSFFAYCDYAQEVEKRLTINGYAFVGFNRPDRWNTRQYLVWKQ